MFIIKDTQIWTHEGLKNWICFNAGLIYEVGSGEPTPDLLKKCQVVSIASNSFIIPGLIDSHIHVQMYGESMMGKNELNLAECKSVDELVKAAKAHDSPDKQFLIGKGWNQTKLGVDQLTSTDADLISKTKPVILFRNCFHLCVLNSFALEMFGLVPGNNNPSKKQPQDAQLNGISAYLLSELDKAKHGKSQLIDIEKSTKQPTGIFRETPLFQIKKYFYSRLSLEEKKAYLDRGLNECLSRGLTCVQTNDFYGAWNVYKALIHELKVPIRVCLTVPFDEIANPASVEPVADDDFVPLADDQIGNLSCHRVKLFADGSLGAMTAAMKNAYPNCKCSHDHGILIETEQELTEKIAFAKERDFRLEIHVIGDKAAETVLKALENAGIDADDRPILTHCQFLGKDILKKMSDTNAIANVQPSFVPSDAEWALKCFGSDKQTLEYAYSWKKLIKAGIVTAGGSDAPVEDANPFWGMHAAIYRTYGPKQTKPSAMKVFMPEERLTFTEAINMYTKAGAYTCGDEDSLGQIKKGYKADFIVINKPIWQSDSSSPDLIDKTWDILRQVQVLEVWVDGKRVFKQ